MIELLTPIACAADPVDAFVGVRGAYAFYHDPLVGRLSQYDGPVFGIEASASILDRWWVGSLVDLAGDDAQRLRKFAMEAGFEGVVVSFERGAPRPIEPYVASETPPDDPDEPTSVVVSFPAEFSYWMVAVNFSPTSLWDGGGFAVMEISYPQQYEGYTLQAPNVYMGGGSYGYREEYDFAVPSEITTIYGFYAKLDPAKALLAGEQTLFSVHSDLSARRRTGAGIGGMILTGASRARLASAFEAAIQDRGYLAVRRQPWGIGMISKIQLSVFQAHDVGRTTVAWELGASYMFAFAMGLHEPDSGSFDLLPKETDGGRFMAMWPTIGGPGLGQYGPFASVHLAF